MSIFNSNTHHDKFIDQLVNMTHDVIIGHPYTCMSTSKSHPTVNQEFQPSTKSQSVPPAVRSLLFDYSLEQSAYSSLIV